jgi:hypothetical protein
MKGKNHLGGSVYHNGFLITGQQPNIVIFSRGRFSVYQIPDENRLDIIAIFTNSRNKCCSFLASNGSNIYSYPFPKRLDLLDAPGWRGISFKRILLDCNLTTNFPIFPRLLCLCRDPELMCLTTVRQKKAKALPPLVIKEPCQEVSYLTAQVNSSNFLYSKVNYEINFKCCSNWFSICRLQMDTQEIITCVKEVRLSTSSYSRPNSYISIGSIRAMGEDLYCSGRVMIIECKKIHEYKSSSFKQIKLVYQHECWRGVSALADKWLFSCRNWRNQFCS